MLYFLLFFVLMPTLTHQVFGGHIGTVLEDMVAKFEKTHGVSRADLSKQLLYFAHDAGSAGCITAEVEALKAVFGVHWNNIFMCNTKVF